MNQTECRHCFDLLLLNPFAGSPNEIKLSDDGHETRQLAQERDAAIHCSVLLEA